MAGQERHPPGFLAGVVQRCPDAACLRYRLAGHPGHGSASRAESGMKSLACRKADLPELEFSVNGKFSHGPHSFS